jgi:hypothetical protein
MCNHHYWRTLLLGIKRNGPTWYRQHHAIARPDQSWCAEQLDVDQRRQQPHLRDQRREDLLLGPELKWSAWSRQHYKQEFAEPGRIRNQLDPGNH